MATAPMFMVRVRRQNVPGGWSHGTAPEEAPPRNEQGALCVRPNPTIRYTPRPRRRRCAHRRARSYAYPALTDPRAMTILVMGPRVRPGHSADGRVHQVSGRARPE